MKQFFIQIFTWWNRQTVGTRFYTWRKGEEVGRDEFGNIYYREAKRDKRWVIYNSLAEASSVPPGWNGWLHHTVDVAPVDEDYQPHSWQQPYVQNLTGTPGAYRPKGSVLNTAQRPQATGDYKAWRPQNSGES